MQVTQMNQDGTLGMDQNNVTASDNLARLETTDFQDKMTNLIIVIPAGNRHQQSTEIKVSVQVENKSSFEINDLKVTLTRALTKTISKNDASAPPLLVTGEKVKGLGVLIGSQKYKLINDNLYLCKIATDGTTVLRRAFFIFQKRTTKHGFADPSKHGSNLSVTESNIDAKAADKATSKFLLDQKLLQKQHNLMLENQQQSASISTELPTALPTSIALVTPTALQTSIALVTPTALPTPTALVIPTSLSTSTALPTPTALLSLTALTTSTALSTLVALPTSTAMPTPLPLPTTTALTTLTTLVKPIALQTSTEVPTPTAITAPTALTTSRAPPQPTPTAHIAPFNFLELQQQSNSAVAQEEINAQFLKE